MSPLTICDGGIMFPGSPSVRPTSVNTDFAWRHISVLGRRVWVKLATTIHYASWQCWNGFQSYRSKVTFMINSINQ